MTIPYYMEIMGVDRPWHRWSRFHHPIFDPPRNGLPQYSGPIGIPGDPVIEVAINDWLVPPQLVCFETNSVNLETYSVNLRKIQEGV